MTRPATPDAGGTLWGPSLQRRVSRFTLLIVALAVLVTGFGAFAATRASTFSAVDDLLIPASDQALERLGPSPDLATIQRYVSTGADLGVVVTVVVASDGREVVGPGAEVLDVDDRVVAVAAGEEAAYSTTVRTPAGSLYRVRVTPLGTRPGYALLVGRTMAATEQILHALALALVGFGLAAVLAAGLVALRIARAGVAPVRELTAEVEQRAAVDDLTPVRVVRTDEIGRLSVAFNHLLDTIKVSRVRQARFVADAGHELRTPLTSMRTNIELLVADTQRSMLPPDDRLAIMRDVRSQLIEFSSLVSDLIGLTREDRTAAEFHEVDLSAVLEESVDRASMLVPGLTWSVDLDPTYLQGEADLLGRALGNVLDNAVKFSPAGGTVTVTLHDGVVSIGDEGRGVVEEERPFIFDRFFRAEASRATPGTGLGLAITESVVRQHGGTVVLMDAPGGGAVFELRFPLTTSRSVRDLQLPAPAPGQTLRAPLARGGAEV